MTFGTSLVCRKYVSDRIFMRLDFMNPLRWEGRETRHSACTPVWPVRTKANRGWLATELLLRFSKPWHVSKNILFVLQYYPSSSIQMDGSCVKWVQCIFCSMAMLVKSIFNTFPYPCYNIFPNTKRKPKILLRRPCLPYTFTYSCDAS